MNTSRRAYFAIWSDQKCVILQNLTSRNQWNLIAFRDMYKLSALSRIRFSQRPLPTKLKGTLSLHSVRLSVWQISFNILFLCGWPYWFDIWCNVLSWLLTYRVPILFPFDHYLQSICPLSLNLKNPSNNQFSSLFFVMLEDIELIIGA